MVIRRYLGRGGLARYVGISEARVGQISPLPDALVDGRPVWLPETAARLKDKRDSRRAQEAAADRVQGEKS
jgi:hypothetical protein